MIYFLIYLWLFYIGFVFYAGCQVAITARQWGVLIPAAPVLLIAGLMDVLFNQTFGRVMFWEWTFTMTFSERLDLHFHNSGWRGSLARDIGNVLDKILPNHIH
ncbi:MAG: hypothetical protein HKM00_02980 [Gallionella sp.]|nr:hypothetical protein [Gallionella sp.]